MRIGYMYDIRTDRPWYAIQWGWVTKKERPNMPDWVKGVYAKHIKLCPALRYDWHKMIFGPVKG